VDQTASGPTPANGAPSASAPVSDISQAPQRGGPLGMRSGAQEPVLDDSPSLAEVLRIQAPESVLDGVALTSRLRRLTRLEYQRTVTDLLGLDLQQIKLEFPEEVATLDGYFALGSLRMTDRLIAEVQRAAEGLAAQFVGDGALVARVAGCDGLAPACGDPFIQSFGRRAYRRPLSESEAQRYRSLFDSAATSAGGSVLAGVQAVVEAMLQSPHFLYRIERGRGVVDELGEQITDYEAATRLSFMLRGTSPDAALLDAAAAGELSTPAGIAQQAQRLVNDPAVAERVYDYHSRWLRLESLAAASKDPARFPEFSPELLDSMRAETARFIEQTTLEGDGAVSALLTAPYTFVDARLASLYGLQGSFGEGLTRVDLPSGSPRAGLLTQASFLAGHSSGSRQTSPILRGVFVLRRLLCQDIPDPPPNAQSMEPEPSLVPLVTTRDYFEWKTSMDACQGCHTRINPVGFALEDFDAIGRYREQEEGALVDASGSLNLGGSMLQYAGGKELAAAIANRPEALACYARNWLRYLWGRADTDADLRTLTRIRQRLATRDYGVRDLLIDVTQSAAFLHLAPLEGQ
jgi:Protein of unknown function (DUF1592)/Protein of unknown function (DUF1588)/Protein of unknown function (DUF1595)/Protein of unknown function (DUF1585)/Protein of unknown function (DUF1587)